MLAASSMRQSRDPVAISYRCGDSSRRSSPGERTHTSAVRPSRITCKCRESAPRSLLIACENGAAFEIYPGFIGSSKATIIAAATVARHNRRIAKVTIGCLRFEFTTGGSGSG